MRANMPDGLAKRPQWKGFPVPYVLGWSGEGAPDFKVVDPATVAKCLKYRLCGLCGLSMRPPVAFLGGPRSAESGLYLDPPSHPDCAEYAARVCPHYAGGKGYADAAHLPDRESYVAAVRPVIVIARRFSRKGEFLQARGIVDRRDIET